LAQSAIYLSLNKIMRMRKLLLTLTAFLFFSGALLAQKTITGKVTDEAGKPIADVSVTAKGTNVGTVTKADGSYSLNLPANAKQIVFSAVEYTPQTVNVGSRNVYSVTLVGAGSKDLGDVVVTGIKNIKKADFSGATSRIAPRNVEDRPVGSFDQLLQGQVPGLLAVTGSGQPGNPTTVVIRGTSSIAGGSNPLYIVDGIPVESGVFQGFNPNDFASVEILKDAASTAIYGSRGAAGVIVVTTKKGRSGKVKLTYGAQFGIKQRPEFAFRPMNTPELLKAQEDYGKIAGGGAVMPGWHYSTANPRYATLTPAQRAAEALLLDSIRGINTDWKDYMFRNGPFSNHEITLSGGTGKTVFFSSLALYNEKGTTPRTDMKRVTLRNNIDYADDKLNVSFTSSLAYTKRNFQQTTVTNNLNNPFLSVNINVPYARVFKANGVDYETGVGSLYAAANQLDLTRYDENYNNQIKGVVATTASYKITKNLTAAATAGIDFRETQGTVYGSKLPFARSNPNVVAPTTREGFLTESLTRLLIANVRPSINYLKVFNERHKVDATAFGEYLRTHDKQFTATGYGIDARTPGTPAAITQGNAVNQLFANVGGRKTQNSLVSAGGILTYSYDGKYAITGTLRTDYSSKLPKEGRQATFYSVGGVWNMHKENFLKSSSFFNSLRLRASYGGAGNADNFPTGADGTDNFTYITTFVGSGNYAGIPTLAVSNFGNNGLKWETTYTLNIGTDFSLWKNRIYGSLEMYDRRIKDLFVRQTLTAPGAALAVTNINAGVLQNKGFEWDISVDVVRKRDFTFTLKSNGGYNWNKVLSLGGVPSYLVGTSRITEGLPLGSHDEVGWAGVDAATGAPLFYRADGTITNDFNQAPKVQRWGTYEAPWKGGFGPVLRYKNLEFSALFSWQSGATKVDNLEFFVENPVGFMSGGYNQSSDLNFWKKPGDVASTPSPLFTTNFSSKIIHDASFIRLRDVQLSYTLPNSVTEKLKFISRARFYVTGTNLFIWTKWRGMDPEAGATNINLSEFPNPRGITGGIDISF
jgi:TonB-linked SusC/RagA family outer membrane protein